MDPLCFKCGEPFFGGSCVWCTCRRCGNDIRNGSCWFCNSNTYNNCPNFSNYPHQPNLYQQNCVRCGRNIIGGFWSFCESSYTYGFNPNYPQNNFNSYEQNPYFNDESFQNAPISQQNGCEYCGGPHFSTNCQTRKPFPCDNDYHDQPPQYEMVNAQNNFTELLDLFKET